MLAADTAFPHAAAVSTSLLPLCPAAPGSQPPFSALSENPGGLRLQPGQVQNAAEHPGGGEGDARLGLAQDRRDAGADVVEKVTHGVRGCSGLCPGTRGTC